MASAPGPAMAGRLTLALLLGLLATAAHGQSPPPLAPLQPLVLAHAQPHGLELHGAPDTGWSLGLGLAYGNTFSSTHQVGTAHRSVDGEGVGLSREALEAAEALWPGETKFLFDTETVRLDLEAARSLGNGLYAGGRMRWWRLGGTGLDGLPGRVHDALGVENGDRDLYPLGETVVFLLHGDRTTLIDRGLDSGFGTVDLWFGRQMSLGGEATHRVWLSAALPMAGDTELGRQGLSWGPRWAAAAPLWRGDLHGGVGWTHQGGDTPTGEDASDTWHAWAGYDLRLARWLQVGLLVRGDSSPYRGLVPGRLDEAVARWALGATLRLSPTLDLQLALGEDIPGQGLSPDFSVQTCLLLRVGG